MRFRTCLLPLCILGFGLVAQLKAEEKNGFQCSVQKVTLDKADVRSDLNVEALDRTMGLRVSLRNTSFRPVPDGEITWEIVKRKFDNGAIELTTGTEKLQSLKAGETADLTLGFARTGGVRNGAVLRQDELEWQITIKPEGQPATRFTSKSSFAALLKRAVKVEVPAPPAGPALVVPAPPAAAVPATPAPVPPKP
jgi:hypothetical protein